jgi:hypothetical protein
MTISRIVVMVTSQRRGPLGGAVRLYLPAAGRPVKKPVTVSTAFRSELLG